MAVKAPIIAGKYTLLRKLGAGGMAEVFLAKQDSGGNFEKLVVIKRILPHLTTGQTNDDFVRMFLDEARLASDLRHPNVVTVIDVGKAGDTHYIVMEFLHGQDVRKVQRKNAAWAEMVPLGHCCQIAIDAAAGLHYAHRKTDLQGRALSIVHRDVSPQNIIVTYEGGTKIVDFGIAKAATQTTHTSVGVLKGKYTYMSPEQAAGEIVDARTDQFALGIVVWELLTMRRLFKRESETATLDAIMAGIVPRPSRFRPDLPREIDDVVMRALARDKRDRYANCETMALALEDACAAAGVTHSRSRLAQYMRRLFADALAEEATLGLLNPDGSVSRNLTPFTLPSPEAGPGSDRIEAPRAHDSQPPEPHHARRPPADATAADRRGARSREESGSRKRRSAVHRPQSALITETDNDTAPTMADDPQEVPAPAAPLASPPGQEPASPARVGVKPVAVERAPAAAPPAARVPPTLLAAGVALAAAFAVVALWVAYGAWSRSGAGVLVIRTEPAGARVFFDGQDTGQTTPALLKDVQVGVPHKVRVVHSSQGSVEEVVMIPRRGSTETLKLELR